MIKLIVLSVAFSLTQLAVAGSVDPVKEKAIKETKVVKPALDMSAANRAHAGIDKDEQKDQPFWSKEQTMQSELEVKYKKAITEHPDNKQNYRYLAGLYLSNNKTLKAIDAYQKAIIYDSKNPRLFAAISIAYLHQSKYNMAKAMADEALRLDPKLESVEKINEYVGAKLAAIEAASKSPSTGDGHGELSPAAGVKPTDKLHNPQVSK